MAKRKRIPLQLDGTDEQYFRTREATGRVTSEEAETIDQPPTAKNTSKPPAPKSRASRKKSVKTTEKIHQPKGEIVSRIIHLGKPLSKRLHNTAEQFGVPIDDLLYAARKKTITNFRQILNKSKKPAIEQFDKGGETLRVAVSLSGEELETLNTWFDPLDLGLGTKMVSPLMTQAFRAEVSKICDAAS